MNYFLTHHYLAELSAAVALYGLWFVSEGVISASFLACLLAYPCLDLLMSIFRRVRGGVHHSRQIMSTSITDFFVRLAAI